MGDASDNTHDPATQNPTPACDRCRSFKKKCTRGLPSCALCISAGQLCSYPQPSESKNNNRQLRARVEWLSYYINKFPPPGGFGRKRRIDDVETGTDLDAYMVANHPQKAQRGHDSHHTPLTPTNLASEQPSTGEHFQVIQVPLSGTSQSTQSEVRQLESISPHSPIIADYNSNDQPSTTSGSVTGGSIRNETEPSLYSEKQQRPNSTARKLVDAFFRHVGRSYPCVDAPFVWSILEAESTPFRIRPNDRKSTVLYLVMAIGQTSLLRVGQLPRDAPEKFEVPYADILNDCLLSPSLMSTRILVLLSLHSIYDPLYPSTWTLSGIASRQAIELGLSRRSPRKATGRDGESEKRHRVYWSAYILDRRMATSLGLQPMLTEENMDIPFPALTVEEFISPQRSQTASALQISQQAIQLSQLEEKILRHIHLRKRTASASLSAEARRLIIKELRIEIENWYSHWCLLASCETDNVPVQSSVTWISARYYHLLMLLHYPTYFNLCNGGYPNTLELTEFAMKYIQSVAILLQQRQLQLNRLTLCRLLPAGLMLMYGFVNVASYPAKNDVALLVEILDAFSDDWTHAHVAADIFRNFLSSLKEPTYNTPIRSWDPTCDNHYRRSISMKQGWAELLSIVQELLGSSSSFCWALAEQMDVRESKLTPVGGGGLGDRDYSRDLGSSFDFGDLQGIFGAGSSGIDAVRRQAHFLIMPDDL